jgi:NADH-quinone oxidoreductase subunit L
MNLTLLILAFPLVGFLALGLFGRALPHLAISVIGCGTVLVGFACALADLFALLGVSASQREIDTTYWTWINAGAFHISFGLLNDPLSAVMLLVVTGVGFLIHFYSIGYMADDPGYWRFFSYLNLFIFTMALLVAADNFVFLLIGWAGVGLTSFLLIGFWYTRPTAVAAARKAFVVNVIGDFGLMIAIFLLFAAGAGSLSYAQVLGLGPLGPQDIPLPMAAVSLAIPLLLFVAAAAKSAQLPLHVWLPDAMEGPTPVSALIHAATMVTAGVYLVARAHVLFEAQPDSLTVVAVVAGASAFFAATIACAQTDIKRVLAYSTMSQLAYMFMGEAAGGFSSGIFHLVEHSFFKALLFMCAGAVIHALGGEQDMRKMGGLRQKLGSVFWLFVIAGLALAAIVPFDGFWSKDAVLGSILAEATATNQPGGWYVLYVVALVTASLTGFYTFRLIFAVFRGEYRGPALTGHGSNGRSARNGSDPLAGIHSPGLAMMVPMVILGVLSVVGWVINVPGSEGLNNFLGTTAPSAAQLPTSAFLLSLVISLAFAVAGIALAWWRYGAGQVPASDSAASPAIGFLRNRWYVDALYDTVIVRPVVAISGLLRSGVEEGIVEGGANGVGESVSDLSESLRGFQTGYLRNYALTIFLGAIIVLIYFIAVSQ